MSDTVSVAFNCRRCGTKLTWDDSATDSTAIACKQCGEHFGTYADLRETAMNAVRGKVEGMLKDAFKAR